MNTYHNYEDLIKNNAIWSEQKNLNMPDFFRELAASQSPPFLYIGCSDSRMPLDTFTQTNPGEMFVHRNIANQVSLTDMNILSVIEYALFTLKIKHLIVCGHYDCGGIKAAYHNQATGLVENWLRPIKDIMIDHKTELDGITDLNKKLNRISELNVISQIETLLKSSLLEKALEADRDKYLHIHGWVLDLSVGKIIELELPIELWREKGLVPPHHTL